MAAAYFESGLADQVGTFELYTRELPKTRSFLIAAGLEQALHYVLNVRFSDDDLKYLRSLSIFQSVNSAFFDYLSEFRFTGDVWAMPEGTVFFENEPIVQVEAPIIEAQILETYLINSLNVQSMVASKATRMCLAAKGRKVVDFGSRRAHGPQAGVLAARASFIGGCDGTSNVLAGKELGIPVFGTMAHSFVQFFDEEAEAFSKFQKVFPDNTIVLVDTYDSLQGIQKALDLDLSIRGIRLDSGDVGELAVRGRDLLDSAGRKGALIFVSGNLDEQNILYFSLRDLPIDGYGVGTDLVVSADAPGCDLVYKLVQTMRNGDVIPKLKTSEEKASYPYRKQVFRRISEGVMEEDLVAKWDEWPESSEVTPLLKQFVQSGELALSLPDVQQVRKFVHEQVLMLPLALKHLHSTEVYPVRFSEPLQEIFEKLTSEYS
jgi:nicotinate phosphoribosyltransferase